MSAPVIVGPEIENKRQSRFAWWLLVIIMIALFATAYFLRGMYEHPTRPSDCTASVDYAATCVRASAPQPTPPPSPVSLYLGTLASAILAVLLVQVAWSASVTKQERLVTAFAGTATTPAAPTAAATPAPATAPSSPATPANDAPRNATLPPLGPHLVAGSNAAAFRNSAPTTIRDNEITPDMIAPPKAAPKAGVDVKSVGGAK